MTTSIPILTTASTPAPDADVLVLGLTKVNDEPTLVGACPDLTQAWDGAFPQDLLTTAITLGARSRLGTVAVLPPLREQRVIVVGLGEVDVTPAAVRHAVGTALRSITGTDGAEAWKVTLSLELGDPELGQAAAEGALLGAYRRPRVGKDDSPLPVGEVELVIGQDAVKEAVTVAGTVAAAVAQARDWVNTPPNLLFPETFAEAGKELVADQKVAVEILDEKALAKGGYGGLLAVGGGSSRSPRLLRLAWAPKGAKFHLALVGKGITFDSGGLDIKPAGQMAAMTSDMSGAAAVIAATRAIAELGLPIKVTTYAAMAENLPSGSAYRSSDVLTMFDGTTVENGNTDAEGRLVMADALGRATRDEPDLIVDVATLTGACMVALGTRTAGLMASDDTTADQLLDAAEAAGEAFWHLPITDDLREGLTSEVADLRSTGKNRWGGALTAAAFLQHFVGETPWAHLDIAGPAFNEDAPWGCTPKGGTGVAVRTLVALATNLAG
ncbi:MAG: leucyl aminopeptidase [Arachnia propionica]|uniref:leucyl aminopeptidase n=1 Tax=Arachnia propionica TaxID=1750 RepID=UPI002709048C|nr:leucyl aminopeptidase [Arachnia propionica]